MTNNKTSILVKDQLPSFMKEDNPLFVSFLEAYYEYMEQENKTLYHSKKLMEYADIDKTISDFSQKLYKEFLQFFPQTIKADRDKILKNIKEFYRTRGTEKSYKFLLKLITGQKAQLYYPKTDILKVSDGKWFIEKSLRIKEMSVNGVANTTLENLIKFENKKITGLNSNATAIVERTEENYVLGELIRELYLSSIIGTFINGEQIKTSFSDDGGTTTLYANIYSGIVNSITVTNPGSGYVVGNPVIFSPSDSGFGAAAVVQKVSTGNVSTIQVSFSGAGFKVGDPLLILGGGGIGAQASIAAVDENGYYHDNVINISTTVLSSMANIKLANLTTNVINTLSTNYFVYSNCGPVSVISISNPGGGYISAPSLDIIANTRLKTLGILGRMEIINGGLNYAVGDNLVFTNVRGSYGFAAAANVTNVQSNGMIDRVDFYALPGHYSGGSGFTQDKLPIVQVSSANGIGANIVVKCIMGEGEILTSTTGKIGAIERIALISGGQNYDVAPNVDLSKSGDGQATAICSVVQGVYTYPGRYINDDGFVSSYNFLQNKEYYQNYSYVIKIRENFIKYFRPILEVLHPSGMKMFGEYVLWDEDKEKYNLLSISNKGYSEKEYYNVDTQYANGSNYFYYSNTQPILSNSSTGSLYVRFTPKELVPNGACDTIVFFGTSNTNYKLGLFLSNSGNSLSGTGNFLELKGKITGTEIPGLYLKSDEVSVPIVNVANEYYDLLASWSKTNVRFYVNGVNCVQQITNVLPSFNLDLSNVKVLSIGAFGNGSGKFVGNISNVIYSNSYIDFSIKQNRDIFTETSQQIGRNIIKNNNFTLGLNYWVSRNSSISYVENERFYGLTNTNGNYQIITVSPFSTYLFYANVFLADTQNLSAPYITVYDGNFETILANVSNVSLYSANVTREYYTFISPTKNTLTVLLGTTNNRVNITSSYIESLSLRAYANILSKNFTAFTEITT